MNGIHIVIAYDLPHAVDDQVDRFPGTGIVEDTAVRGLVDGIAAAVYVLLGRIGAAQRLAGAGPHPVRVQPRFKGQAAVMRFLQHDFKRVKGQGVALAAGDEVGGRVIIGAIEGIPERAHMNDDGIAAQIFGVIIGGCYITAELPRRFSGQHPAQLQIADPHRTVFPTGGNSAAGCGAAVIFIVLLLGGFRGLLGLLRLIALGLFIVLRLCGLLRVLLIRLLGQRVTRRRVFPLRLLLPLIRFG